MNKSLDYILSQYINWLPKFFVLNVAWFLYSLPLFTIGSATRGLLYTFMEGDKVCDGKIFKQYRRVYRKVRKKYGKTDLIWSCYLVLLLLNLLLSLSGRISSSPLVSYFLGIAGTGAIFIYMYQIFLEGKFGRVEGSFWVALYHFCKKPLYILYHYVVTVLLVCTLAAYVPALFLIIGGALVFVVNLKIVNYKLSVLINRAT